MLGPIGPTTLSPGKFLARSPYIVVNPDKSGDYTDVASAVAAAPVAGYVLVLGSYSAGTITINKNLTIVMGAGATCSKSGIGGAAFSIDGGGAGIIVTFIGLGNSRIAGGVAAEGITLVGAGDTLQLFNMLVIGGTAQGVRVQGAATQGLIAENTIFGSSGQYGLNTNDAILSARLRHCSFFGTINGASSGVAWANAPFYHCSFGGGRNNITFAGANLSNVDY